MNYPTNDIPQGSIDGDIFNADTRKQASDHPHPIERV